MTITTWPEAERPREKLLNRGADALSDAELLAIFIRTGSRGRTAVDIARELLKHYDGSLCRLLNAQRRELLEYTGLGPAKYALLQAAVEVGRRYEEEGLQSADLLNNPKQAGKFLLRQMRNQTQEHFSVIYLDNNHRYLKYEVLFTGTLNSAAVHPREVVVAALRHNAAAMIVAHNHPSGVAEPSLADEQITTRLRKALELVEVRLLDHLIIGNGQVFSFSERGML